jgi:tRNA threonylcarbamoyladenosine biosynthesis protein TsaE
MGIDPDSVSSPTFSIVNEYRTTEGRGLVHIDVYRLEQQEELEGIGFWDLLGPDRVVAIEWGSRFATALPRERVAIELGRESVADRDDDALPSADSRARSIESRGFGERPLSILKRWEEVLRASGSVELE